MKFRPEQLESLITRIFVAAGTPQDIALYVSSSLVESSLKGVDSHGVMRASLYVDQILGGWIKPAARPAVLKETQSMAVVSAGSGFGIFALGYAMDLAIEKAKANQVAAIGLVDCTHTGRIGQFVEYAATRGVISTIIGGGHKGAGMSVAPYGGAARIMATNPYAIGLPGGQYGAVVVDIAMSMAAEGKLQVYRSRHEALPSGWILDKEGKPSTDVEDFYKGGCCSRRQVIKVTPWALQRNCLVMRYWERPTN